MVSSKNKKRKKHNNKKNCSTSSSSSNSDKTLKKVKTKGSKLDTSPLNSESMNISGGMSSSIIEANRDDKSLKTNGNNDSQKPESANSQVLTNNLADQQVISDYSMLYPADFSGVCLINVFDERPEEHLGNLHSMSFGKKLSDNGFTPKSIHPKGNDKIAVTFRTAKEANEFILQLKSKINPHWSTEIDPADLFTVGLIYDVDPQLTESDITNGLSSPDGTNTIHSVVRIKRTITAAEEPITTNTDKIKILCKDSLPSHLYSYANFRQVHKYIPPVLRCRTCQHFGHGARFCPSGMKICVNCSFPHEEEECTYSTRCANCQLPHRADDKECMHFIFNKKVVETRTLLKCSKREAIFRVRESEQAKACHRVLNQTEDSNSLISGSPTNRTNTTPTPRTIGKHIGKRYASKCLDKFVKSIDQLFDTQDNELYNQIKNLGKNFMDNDISFCSSEVDSVQDE